MLKVTNQNQFALLVQEMEKNPQLARGFHKGVAKLDARKAWDTISEKCNSLGPPVRDGEGWLKVWSDLKFKVKKKVVFNKKESRATGGGINNQKSLSNMESAVANLMCFESMVNPPGTSFGGEENPNSSQILEELNETDEMVFEEDVEQQNIEPVAKKSKVQKEALLNRQIDIQQNFYEEISRKMSKIEKHSESTERYTRKMYELKKEKLKLYKSELKMKQDNIKKANELREVEINIKKKKNRN